MKEEINISYVNKNLNISDINADKLKEVTSQVDSPE